MRQSKDRLNTNNFGKNSDAYYCYYRVYLIKSTSGCSGKVRRNICSVEVRRPFRFPEAKIEMEEADILKNN